MKYFNIMGVHQFLGEAVTKKYMRSCLKRRAIGQFAGGLAKNREEAGFEEA